MRNRRFIWVVCAILAILALGIKFHAPGISWMMLKLQGKKTVSERVAQYGPAARNRMSPFFKQSGVEYPPRKVVLVGMKKERTLQMYVSSGKGLHFVRSYPIHGASGKLGPKLREGDMQVPEGFYGIDSLNANSVYHISMRVNYPNQFDRDMARLDGRNDLGGNIMIHGGNGSAGCLAMGDETSEELFVLASDTGAQNIEVILTPVDFRVTALKPSDYHPTKWTTTLYRKLARKLSELPDSDNTVK